MQKHERELLVEVRSVLPEGWKASLDTSAKRHPKIVLSAPDGGEHRLTYPRSPSDNRWMKNCIAFVNEVIGASGG